MSTSSTPAQSKSIVRPYGVEAAAPRVAESTGKNLGLAARHAVDVEPDDFAQGARFASCSTTVSCGKVEMPIIVTRTEEDLAGTLLVGRVPQLRRQTHGEDPPHFSWSSSSSSPLMKLKQQIKGNNN